jgi:hypothetical protein
MITKMATLFLRISLAVVDQNPCKNSFNIYWKLAAKVENEEV